jgi:CRISPR/Cas system Type II protein with McrA/HNH and RuvC-like nuclease domain
MRNRERLYRDQNGKCALCGMQLQIDKERCHDDDYLHIDHIVPKANGGKSALSNYRGVCRSCNIKRRHMSGERLLKRITGTNKKAIIREIDIHRLKDDLNNNVITTEDIDMLIEDCKCTYKKNIEILRQFL